MMQILVVTNLGVDKIIGGGGRQKSLRNLNLSPMKTIFTALKKNAGCFKS